MSTLSVTHTYLAGTLAKASEVNTNFTNIVNWGNGQIQNDNLGTFSGPITWTITTGVLAGSITNSGDQGSFAITQSVAMQASKAVIKITDTANQSAAEGDLFIDAQHASSSKPLIKVKNAGSGDLFHGTDGSDAEKFKVTSAGLMRLGGSDGPSLSRNAASELLVANKVRLENSSDGPLLSRAAANLLLVDDKIQLDNSTDGPAISRSAANTLLVETQLRIGDSTGPLLTRSAAGRLTLFDELQLGTGGPVAANVGGGRFQVNNDIHTQGVLAAHAGTLRLESSGGGGFDIQRSSNTLNWQGRPLPTTDVSGEQRILHFTASGTGNQSGSGYSLNRDSAGRYTITFSPAFSSTPVVVVTPDFNVSTPDMRIANYDSLSASSVRIVTRIYTPIGTGTPTVTENDSAFNFIAIGTR